MSRFIEHSMNLNTVKHSQDDLYFRTKEVDLKGSTGKKVGADGPFSLNC